MKQVYINIGHSDKDPGAVGYETERKLAVIVSNHQRDYLLANYDCQVRMNPGTMGDLTAIANDANQWGADLFVSNHFNAGGGDGYEALVHNEKRVPLGKIFAKHVAAIGQNLRSSSVAPGVKLRPNLAVLRLTNMPAVLNEGAFVDNLKDIQDWNDDAELKKLGIAYAKACAEFLTLEEKQPAPAAPVTQTVSISLPVLSKGSEGQSVKALQNLLIGEGYNLDPYGADGDFGDITESAVGDYQQRHGLTVDGIVGEATWTSLLGG